MGIPILIDTDAGEDIDDVLAIAFAALRPELSIQAVTTVTHGTLRRACLIKKLLAAAGHPMVPVAAGMELPLRPLGEEELARLTDEAYVLNHAPFVTDDLDPEDQPEKDGVGLIISTVEQNAGEIGLVCIGPLTNIAVALRRAPQIAGQIKWIACMGGEVHSPRVEHNIEWDYDAAAIVFSAGIPLFLGTWSVTRRFVLEPEDCDIIKAHPSHLGEFLRDCLELWWPHKAHKVGPMMYDIAPFLWAMGTELYETELMSIQVETKGELTKGLTLRSGNEMNALVSIGMDADAIKRLYLETLLN